MPLSNCTVTIHHVTTVLDELGDGTPTETTETLEWALIAPRASSERTDPRTPAVITQASIYGPFGTALDADDTIVVSGHSPSMDGAWQVEGRSGDWSLGDWRPGFEVAVKRASGV